MLGNFGMDLSLVMLKACWLESFSWILDWKCGRRFGPNFLVGSQLKLSNQNSFNVTKLRSIQKFPSNHPSVAPILDPFTTQSQFHHTPHAQCFAFSHQENIHPHTQPTTHLTFPPKLLPLTPPRLRLTHGLYQAVFAASWVTLYSYYRLDPTSGSSPGCQSRIQS